MREALQKLLDLQERDRDIAQSQAELQAVEPQRQALLATADRARTRHHDLKSEVQHLESQRKDLELEVQAKQALVGRYSAQLWETRKNDEYRALSHEIEACKREIVGIEDRELEIMEKVEASQRQARDAARAAEEGQKEVERRLGELAEREGRLKDRIATLAAGRQQMAGAVDPGLLSRYERTRRNRGDRVLVGIEHSACGGCHVQLPMQVVVSCQSPQELINCPNCGRILYHREDMDLRPAE